MKMRVTFLPLIALAALTTAFGVKTHKKQDQLPCDFSYNFGPPIGTQCYEWHTDQDDCSPGNTGAVCTTTPGSPIVGSLTAYAVLAAPRECQLILRQP
jgi:hypothetical protein